MIPFLLIAGGGYLLFDALGNSRKSFDPLDYGFPTKGYRGYRKGAAHFSDGGMTAGRWYRDKTGEEFKYIGKIDNGPQKGQLLFSDGKKSVYKTLQDFESERPKESKLFGWFADGGTLNSKYEYAVYFSRFRNGRKIPIVTGIFKTIEEAENSIGSAKGYKVQEISKLPIQSEIAIYNEEKRKFVKNIVHSKEKVDDFFKGKDSFYRGRFAWVIPFGYEWENWEMVKSK